jgi:hypothetical protein
MFISNRWFGRLAALGVAAGIFGIRASASQVLFSDSFDGTSVDTAKWRIDGRPFESGQSDIAALWGAECSHLEGR